MTFNVQLWKWLSISVDVFPHWYMHPFKQRDGEEGLGIVGGMGCNVVPCRAAQRSEIVTARSSPASAVEAICSIYVYICIYILHFQPVFKYLGKRTYSQFSM